MTDPWESVSADGPAPYRGESLSMVRVGCCAPHLVDRMAREYTADAHRWGATERQVYILPADQPNREAALSAIRRAVPGTSESQAYRDYTADVAAGLDSVFVVLIAYRERSDA